MATLEERINALKRENEARKASYQISGGKVVFILQKSETYKKTGANNVPVTLRVKFVPAAVASNGITLTSLSAQVSYDSAFTSPVEDATAYNETQNGDGSVIINVLAARVPFNSTDYFFRITATGPSKGTFTLL